jgi:cytochrome c oxidase subunit 2
MHFKNGIRAGDLQDSIGNQMAAIAKTLKDETAIKSVVAYIQTLPANVPISTLKGDAENGKSYYSMICGACHGPEGKGNKILNSPSLVGMDDWYLERQFNNFKNNIRGSHPDDNFGAQMQPMARTLPDELAIRDVIAYLQTFNQEQL